MREGVHGVRDDLARRLARIQDDLKREFPQVPDESLTEEFNREVTALLANARFHDFVPVLTHRAVRARLLASATTN